MASLQLLGEKENHIWLYAGHYFQFIVIIIGLGIELSIANIWFYIWNKICDLKKSLLH